MKATIKWVENMEFVAETGSGHAIVIDGPPDLGGQNLGPRPMELLLVGLGSCAAVDVIHILKKGRHQIIDCKVELTAERADTDPKIFTAIHLHFVVTGLALSEKTVNRAIELSAEKYCSASAMLGKAATITHSFGIHPPIATQSDKE